MTAEDFFAEVEEALGKTKGSDDMGCAYFISDMEKLFEEWESEDHEYKIFD